MGKMRPFKRDKAQFPGDFAEKFQSRAGQFFDPPIKAFYVDQIKGKPEEVEIVRFRGSSDYVDRRVDYAELADKRVVSSMFIFSTRPQKIMIQDQFGKVAQWVAGSKKELAAIQVNEEQIMGTMAQMIAERWDAYMRHCVAGVTKGGKSKARAFAICKAGGNRAGYYEPGTKKVTAKGRKAMRAHARDAAAAAKDVAYERAIKQEETMTGMRQLIGRLEEAKETWTAAQERACLQAAQRQLATHGYRWKLRVDASSGAIAVDVLIPGTVGGDPRDAGTLNIEVGRTKTAAGSQMEAGAHFIPTQGRPYWLVDGKAIPQSKLAGWPPPPEETGIEAGDMIAQVYEMALSEGFVGK